MPAKEEGQEVTTATDTRYQPHWPRALDRPPHGPIANLEPPGPGFWHRDGKEHPTWVVLESFEQTGFDDETEAKSEYRRLFEQFSSHRNVKYFTQRQAALFAWATAHRWPKR